MLEHRREPLTSVCDDGTSSSVPVVGTRESVGHPSFAQHLAELLPVVAQLERKAALEFESADTASCLSKLGARFWKRHVGDSRSGPREAARATLEHIPCEPIGLIPVRRPAKSYPQRGAVDPRQRLPALVQQHRTKKADVVDRARKESQRVEGPCMLAHAKEAEIAE